MKKIKVAVIGAGQRGEVYADYALNNPLEMEVVAVADPDPERRNKLQKLHGLSNENSFRNWEDLFNRPQLADAVFICTQDKMHFEPTMKALEIGYHVLLEKPMATTPEECLQMVEQGEKYNRIFLICHVLRYTRFFSTIKQLLKEGRIGKLTSIQHNENVGFWHQAHSFVRGNWRNSVESSPMILAKSCHDLDILQWIVEADCVNISSFGSLSHFTSENAPKGAPARCLDGCPAAKTCPYYAPNLYLGQDTGWPTSTISNDMSYEGRLKALQEGPYGRCVYHCDNDVVDHQVVNMEFENNVTVAFTMSAFTAEVDRTIKLMGTEGELHGTMEKGEIELTYFQTGIKEKISLKMADGHIGHGGGDPLLVESFLNAINGGSEKLTSATNAMHSHFIAFAAEEARKTKQVIHLSDFKELIKNNI